MCLCIITMCIKMSGFFFLIRYLPSAGVCERLYCKRSKKLAPLNSSGCSDVFLQSQNPRKAVFCKSDVLALKQMSRSTQMYM